MPAVDTVTAKDLPVLEKVLQLFPDLELVALIGIHARVRGLTYPLKAHADLGVLFPSRATKMTFRGHAVTRDQVVAHLPKEFFPIRSEDEFLRRIVIALQAETMSAKRVAQPHQPNDTVFFDPAFRGGIPGGI